MVPRLLRFLADAGIAEVHLELGRARQHALDQRLRERILDVLLQRPAQRRAP